MLIGRSCGNFSFHAGRCDYDEPGSHAESVEPFLPYLLLGWFPLSMPVRMQRLPRLARCTGRDLCCVLCRRQLTKAFAEITHVHTPCNSELRQPLRAAEHCPRYPSCDI